MPKVFKVNDIPIGRHSIKIDFLGYENSTIQELIVGTGKEIDLTIPTYRILATTGHCYHQSDPQNGAALNDMATVSARSFSVDQVKRYAASINDPARMTSTFAGVAGNSELSNALIIRGNSPKGVLWRMEGVEIPNPSFCPRRGYGWGC
ncbi:MAG: hypothetical protein R2822_21995 [Spirosomataceae bacterium]